MYFLCATPVTCLNRIGSLFAEKECDQRTTSTAPDILQGVKDITAFPHHVGRIDESSLLSLASVVGRMIRFFEAFESPSIPTLNKLEAANGRVAGGPIWHLHAC